MRPSWVDFEVSVAGDLPWAATNLHHPQLIECLEDNTSAVGRERGADDALGRSRPCGVKVKHLSLARRESEHELRFKWNVRCVTGFDVRQSDLAIRSVEQLVLGQPLRWERKHVVERRDLLAQDSELAPVVLEIDVGDLRSIRGPRRGIHPSG